MNGKGRLEHIKLLNQLFIKHEKAEEHQRADEYLLGLWQEHGSWIIEQLGRVQELEEQLKDRDSAISTGLRDKREKEIYNGDVIKRYKESVILGKKTKVEFYQKIVYVDKYAQYLLEDKNGVQEHASWASTGEVVGNIHEDIDLKAWE